MYEAFALPGVKRTKAQSTCNSETAAQRTLELIKYRIPLLRDHPDERPPHVFFFLFFFFHFMSRLLKPTLQFLCNSLPKWFIPIPSFYFRVWWPERSMNAPRIYDSFLIAPVSGTKRHLLHIH